MGNPWKPTFASLVLGLSPRNRITVVLGLGCGLRQGEVFGLSPEDIDYARDVEVFPPVEVELPWGKPAGQPRKFCLLLTTRFGDAIAVNTWNTYAWKPASAKAGIIPPRA
ncbi:hypothetical protein AB0O05_38375 [Streptomyces sp. NPDC093084]|uniref:hypothetical protein n=1 Tax=Streptomyces sp. NPDC093084 TaxID=3155197 RepID=UPI00343B1CEA